MGTQEKPKIASPATLESMSSPPRISFSIDLSVERDETCVVRGEKECNSDFEFLSDGSSLTMSTADELFFEGRLLSLWQAQSTEKLQKITLKEKKEEVEKEMDEEANQHVGWYIDEDPSPRPPKCTVLWKELLRFKKQHPPSAAAAAAPSSSSASLVGLFGKDDGKEVKDGQWKKEKNVKRTKKGLERKRSASVRIRPVVHVPICTTPVKNNTLPLLFALRKD